MKKNLFYFSVLWLTTLSLFSQPVNFSWARTPINYGLVSNAKSIATDQSGNSVIVGHYRSPIITFGSYTLANAGQFNNAFIAKYDPSGNVLWAKSAGGTNQDMAQSVATDAAGNVFVTGHAGGPSIIFGKDTLFNMGGDDIFVVKYDTAGNEQWAKSFGGNSHDAGFGIATDANGDVFVTGTYSSGIAVFDSDTLKNTGGTDIFVLKCNTNGNVLWAKSAGGPSLVAKATSIATDANGNAFVTGNYGVNSMVFSSSVSLPFTGGVTNFFLAKYDPAGQILWAKAGGLNKGGEGKRLATDAAGNVYVTGIVQSPTMTFDTLLIPNNGVFIVKYSAGGQALWARSSGGGTTGGSGHGVVVSPTGALYVTGWFDHNQIIFGTDTLINTNFNYDLFIAKYTLNGNPVWATSCQGTGSELAQGIALDNNNDLLITGIFFSPTLTLSSITLTNSNSTGNAFITKLSDYEISTHVKESLAVNSIRVFPNPANTWLNIDSATPISDVVVLNLHGETIKKSGVHSSRAMIPTDGLEPGLYLLVITFEDGRFISSKVVIE